jgi:hypothetical protein
MNMSSDNGKARSLNISRPKQNKVSDRITSGMAGRAAEGLDPKIPYTLIIKNTRKQTPPIQQVLTGVFAIKYLFCQITYPEINGIDNA